MVRYNDFVFYICTLLKFIEKKFVYLLTILLTILKIVESDKKNFRCFVIKKIVINE